MLNAALLASVILMTACGAKSGPAGKAAADKGAPPRAVKALPVREMPLERSLAVIGSLEAFEKATLSVKVAGRLQEIDVDLGTEVKQGQRIARIDPRDYQLQLRQAEALLTQARARLGVPLDGSRDDLSIDESSTVRQARALLDEAARQRERARSLSAQGILSPADLDAAEAAYAVAVHRHEESLEEARQRQALLAQRRVEVEIAQQQLADTEIVAPFNGAIQERRASPGEYLSPGTPVAVLVRADPLRLRLEVPERSAAAIRIGQRVRLSIEGDPNVHTGRIQRLSPVLDPDTRMLVVEADVPRQGGLRPGLFARAQIVTAESEPSLTAPKAALVTFAGVEKMFLITDGKAVEKPVVTGQHGEDWVEIKSGLSAGDLVILKPGNLRAGQAVTVEEKPEIAEVSP